MQGPGKGVVHHMNLIKVPTANNNSPVRVSIRKTRRYGPLRGLGPLIAPAKGLWLWPRLFLPLNKKGSFLCSVVSLLSPNCFHFLLSVIESHALFICPFAPSGADFFKAFHWP